MNIRHPDSAEICVGFCAWRHVGFAVQPFINRQNIFPQIFFPSVQVFVSLSYIYVLISKFPMVKLTKKHIEKHNPLEPIGYFWNEPRDWNWHRMIILFHMFGTVLIAIQLWYCDAFNCDLCIAMCIVFWGSYSTLVWSNYIKL